MPVYGTSIQTMLVMRSKIRMENLEHENWFSTLTDKFLCKANWCISYMFNYSLYHNFSFPFLTHAKIRRLRKRWLYIFRFLLVLWFFCRKSVVNRGVWIYFQVSRILLSNTVVLKLFEVVWSEHLWVHCSLACFHLAFRFICVTFTSFCSPFVIIIIHKITVKWPY